MTDAPELRPDPQPATADARARGGMPHVHAGPAAASRYRVAFFATLAAAAVLALTTLALWWRLHHAPSMPMARAAAAPDATKEAAASRPAPPAAADGAGARSAVAPAEPEAQRAPIQLSPQRLQSIGVRTGKVVAKSLDDEVRLAGNVQVDERRLAYVQTRFAGWIRRVYAASTGDFVRRGQRLFTIYSPELVVTEQEYLLAKKNQLALRGSSLDGVAAGAASLLGAARARLLQWEVPPREIEQLDATGKAIADLAIDSPAAGYITEKNALPNLYVQPETRLYTVADLSRVWVMAQAFQNDAGRIKPGDVALVTVDAYPGLTFSGRVEALLPQVEMATRTLPVRLALANPGLELRPGMYVDVRVRLPLGRQLVIPASAAFHSGTRNLVFLYRGGGNIEPHEVGLGARVGDEIVVTRGLGAGEEIVTSANFLIDSEAQLQAAAGAFMPPPPGAGAAVAMNAPTPAQAAAAAELTTDPSPPRKGGNTVRVRLTGPDGGAIAGAEVTVTFFMPAMPAMGMAAMSTVVRAGDQGGGLYEGKGELASGGAWQVTVTARRQGRTLVEKRLTVDATGGM
jgi:RND family efflux transporter MFP subunit